MDEGQAYRPEGADAPMRDTPPLEAVINEQQVILEDLDNAASTLQKRLRPISRQINEKAATENSMLASGTKVSDNGSTMVQMISTQNSRARSILRKLREATEYLEV